MVYYPMVQIILGESVDKMATVKLNGKVIRAKVKPTRNPALVDEKYLGNEPVWDKEECDTMAPETRDNLLRHAFRYYNYFYNQIGRAHV